MLKKIASACLAGAMLLAMSACGDSKTGSEPNAPSSSSGTSSGDAGISQTEFKSQYADKDYDGAYFKFLYWYDPSEYAQRKVAAFNKQFNANIEITITREGLPAELAKAVASGQPYDIIANHGQYYPSLILSELLEPLDEYITDTEMCDVDNPAAGGLSQDVLTSFSLGGKKYAAGSAKSIYSDMLMYNKKMFADAGLEDPWTLYKDGKWTWEKMQEMGAAVTDIANGVAFLERPQLYQWLTLNGLDFVVRDGDTFTENLTDENILAATQSYRDLMFGETPITFSTGGGGVEFSSGKAYMMVSQTDGYTQMAKTASTSSAFDRDANNVGVVPVPTLPLNTSGKYPGHAPQGYSVSKGAEDPSIAVAYAVFESSLQDSDIGAEGQMPAEVRNEIDTLFAKGGFISYCGFMDSSGNFVTTALANVEKDLLSGGDPAALLNSNRNIITRLINDALS